MVKLELGILSLLPEVMTAPHYHDHRKRLRQRFHNTGSDSCADYELLELLLFMLFQRVMLSLLQKPY